VGHVHHAQPEPLRSIGVKDRDSRLDVGDDEASSRFDDDVLARASELDAAP